MKTFIMKKQKNYTGAVMSYNDLNRKIKNKEVRVGIVGLGYVGLPLAVEFASSGINTTGFEVSGDKVEKLQKGNSYIQDVPGSDLKKVIEKTFKPTTDFKKIKDQDAIIICVPTPLRKSRDPDLSYIIKASETVSQNLSGQTLVILESTSYPVSYTHLTLPTN